jgi:hypothetical protein
MSKMSASIDIHKFEIGSRFFNHKDFSTFQFAGVTLYFKNEKELFDFVKDIVKTYKKFRKEG